MSDIYEVESIKDFRANPVSKFEFLLKWKGYHDKFNTWEPLNNLKVSQETYRDAWRLINKNIKKSGYKRQFRRLCI